MGLIQLLTAYGKESAFPIGDQKLLGINEILQCVNFIWLKILFWCGLSMVELGLISWIYTKYCEPILIILGT